MSLRAPQGRGNLVSALTGLLHFVRNDSKYITRCTAFGLYLLLVTSDKVC